MNRTLCWLIVVALAASTGVTLPAAGQSVGQLLNVSGTVNVQRTGHPLHAGLLFQLKTGDIVAVGAGGIAEAVLYASGARYLIPASSSAMVSAQSLSRRSGSAPKQMGAFSKDLAGSGSSRNSSGSVLGVRVRGEKVDENGQPVQHLDQGPRFPRPVGAVRSGPITLRWEGPVDADVLRVRVHDDENTYVRADLPPTARQYPVAANALKPGKTYEWHVVAVKNGEKGQDLSVFLHILSPEEAARLDRIKKEADAAMLASPRDPAPLLLLASAYEQNQLIDDAIITYQKALRLRAADPAIQKAIARLTRIEPKPAGNTDHEASSK